MRPEKIKTDREVANPFKDLATKAQIDELSERMDAQFQSVQACLVAQDTNLTNKLDELSVKGPDITGKLPMPEADLSTKPVKVSPQPTAPSPKTDKHAKRYRGTNAYTDVLPYHFGKEEGNYLREIGNVCASRAWLENHKEKTGANASRPLYSPTALVHDFKKAQAYAHNCADLDIEVFPTIYGMDKYTDIVSRNETDDSKEGKQDEDNALLIAKEIDPAIERIVQLQREYPNVTPYWLNEFRGEGEGWYTFHREVLNRARKFGMPEGAQYAVGCGVWETKAEYELVKKLFDEFPGGVLSFHHYADSGDPDFSKYGVEAGNERNCRMQPGALECMKNGIDLMTGELGLSCGWGKHLNSYDIPGTAYGKFMETQKELLKNRRIILTWGIELLDHNSIYGNYKWDHWERPNEVGGWGPVINDFKQGKMPELNGFGRYLVDNFIK